MELPAEKPCEACERRTTLPRNNISCCLLSAVFGGKDEAFHPSRQREVKTREGGLGTAQTSSGVRIQKALFLVVDTAWTWTGFHSEQ
jgi:hypothetical protein